MGGLTKIILAVSLVPSALAVVLRHRIPWPVTAVLAQVAATGVLVATAASDRLAPATTRMLGKKDDGHISPLGLAAWWSYHLGLRTKLWVQWRSSEEPLYNQILEDIYLGGWPESQAALPPGKALSVIDVTCELPKTHSHRYLALHTWDTQAPTPKQIQRGVDWALKERAEGRPLYIHCAHGHGRSATVCAALLIELGLADSKEQAVAIMRSSRPRVRLNAPQSKAVSDWMASRGAGSHPNDAK